MARRYLIDDLPFAIWLLGEACRRRAGAFLTNPGDTQNIGKLLLRHSEVLKKVNNHGARMCWWTMCR